ncbi:MAG: hypothetical protein PUB77_07700 [Clostridiales bacterium]|nr:hypothetical protein [Clostridiales bacterium]
MNAEFFENMIREEYRKLPDKHPYSEDQCVDILFYFFGAYRATRHEEHPYIKRVQISRLLGKMPFFNESGTPLSGEFIVPEAYPALIVAYFSTHYPNCNYHINHFFSGRIRELKYLECCY